MLVTQLGPTLCDPMNPGSHEPHEPHDPPGSSVDGIIQAKILEWIVIPFSRGSSWLRDRTWVSCIAGRFFTIPATITKAKKKKECLEILTEAQQL